MGIKEWVQMLNGNSCAYSANANLRKLIEAIKEKDKFDRKVLK